MYIFGFDTDQEIDYIFYGFWYDFETHSVPFFPSAGVIMSTHI